MHDFPARAVLTAMWCAAACGHAFAAAWAPSAGWGLRVDEHRTASADRFAAVSQTFLPGLAIVRGEPGVSPWSLDAAARGRIELTSLAFTSLAGPSRHGASGDASVRIDHAWSQGSLASLKVFGSRARDVLDVDEGTVLRDGDVARWGGWGEARSHTVELAARAHGWRLGAAGSTRDASALAWAARWRPVAVGATALGLGWSERRLELGGERVVRSRSATLGARRRVSDQTAASIEVGAADVASGPDPARRRLAYAFEWGPTEDGSTGTTARLRYRREVGDEFSAEIGHVLGAGRTWIRGESIVDVDGAIRRTPAVIHRGALGGEDTLAAGTVVGAQASVEKSRAFGDETRVRARVDRVSTWVTRALRPWLDVRVAWDVLRQTGLGPDPAPSFRRTRLELSFKAHPV